SARYPAGAAVVDVRADVELAAVVGHHVAVAEAGRAHVDGAGAGLAMCLVHVEQGARDHRARRRRAVALAGVGALRAVALGALVVRTAGGDRGAGARGLAGLGHRASLAGAFARGVAADAVDAKPALAIVVVIGAVAAVADLAAVARRLGAAPRRAAAAGAP